MAHSSRSLTKVDFVFKGSRVYTSNDEDHEEVVHLWFNKA
jgi:hypothetical protein